MSECEYADFAAERWARMSFSEAEIEAINNGGAEVTVDWTKIKL